MRISTYMDIAHAEKWMFQQTSVNATEELWASATDKVRRKKRAGKENIFLEVFQLVNKTQHIHEQQHCAQSQFHLMLLMQNTSI